MGLAGGKDVGETTRKIMRSVMTNDLARRFNYAGHGSKHAFGALQLKDVVTGDYS